MNIEVNNKIIEILDIFDCSTYEEISTIVFIKNIDKQYINDYFISKIKELLLYTSDPDKRNIKYKYGYAPILNNQTRNGLFCMYFYDESDVDFSNMDKRYQTRFYVYCYYICG